MSNATATTKSKPKPKPRSNARVKSDRAETNRRNAQKSTGPRTAEGKGRSRYNATTHGMTARSPLLPGEDAAALAALQDQLIDDLQPRNQLEARLVCRIGTQLWRADHAESAADRRAAFRVRHEPLERANDQKDEALELGERLLWKPSLPVPLESSTTGFSLDEPRCIDDPKHPRNPARLLLRLESTVAGCDWLFERWADLSRLLSVEAVWRPLDALRLVRLTGKHAVDMEHDFGVAEILLCSLVLMGQSVAGVNNELADWRSALVHMLVSFQHEFEVKDAKWSVSQCRSFHHRLADVPLARLAPESAEHARQLLMAVIDGAGRRLRRMRAELQSIAQADADQAPARLAYEEGAEGERHRRYILSNDRLVNRTVSEFLHARKLSETGALKFDSFVISRPSSTLARPEVEPIDEPATSAEGEISCDDQLILRNEARSSGDRFTAVVIEDEENATAASVPAAADPGPKNEGPGDRPLRGPAGRGHARRERKGVSDIELTSGRQLDRRQTSTVPVVCRDDDRRAGQSEATAAHGAAARRFTAGRLARLSRKRHEDRRGPPIAERAGGSVPPFGPRAM
jgi:hypothetical protein